MIVRGVQIVVVRGPVESSGAELQVSEREVMADGVRPDELRLRSVCAAALMEAAVRKLETVALPAAGVAQGASPVPHREDPRPGSYPRGPRGRLAPAQDLALLRGGNGVPIVRESRAEVT